MRKLLFLVTLALCLYLPVVSYAASIGGAQTEGKGKVSLGIDSAFVFERDLDFKKSNGLLELGVTMPALEIDKGHQVMFKASYGLFDNVDIYTKLGVARYNKLNSTAFAPPQFIDFDYHTNTDFAYGFGIKGTHDIGNNWLIGCDVQYVTSKHKLKYDESIAGGKDPATTESGNWKDARFQEWHVAPYVARKIKNFTPYFGVRYSDLKLNFKKPSGFNNDVGTFDYKFNANTNVGVFVGTDYAITKNLKLNLEGRFVDETAMSFGCTYTF